LLDASTRAALPTRQVEEVIGPSSSIQQLQQQQQRRRRAAGWVVQRKGKKTRRKWLKQNRKLALLAAALPFQGFFFILLPYMPTGVQEREKNNLLINYEYRK